MKKKLAVLLALASIASASSAMAATIYNSRGAAFPTQTLNGAGNTSGLALLTLDSAPSLTNAYKVAYEVYSPVAGATTLAGDGISFGQLNIALTQPLIANQNVNVRVSNQSAVFNSAGPGLNRYGICRLTNAAGTAFISSTSGTLNADIASATCLAGNIVATMPPSGVTTDNLGLQVVSFSNAGAAQLTAALGYVNTFNTAVTAAAGVYNASPKAAGDLTTYTTAVAAANTTLLASLAAPSTPLDAAFLAAVQAARTNVLTASATTTTGVNVPAGVATAQTALTNLVTVGSGSTFNASTVASNAVIRLVQWNDNAGAGNNSQLDAGETLTNGASLFVLPGLPYACDKNPIVQMTFSSSGGESSGSLPINFAYVTPQFVFTPPTGNTLNAELNTDVDFRRITVGSNDSATSVVTGLENGVTYVNQLFKPNFFAINNTAPYTNVAPDAAPNPSLWIDYASVSPTGNVSYTLTTAALEPGIVATTGVQADGTINCTAAPTTPVGGTVYTCSGSPVGGLIGNHSLRISLNGVGENNPTNWTFTNFAASGVCPTAYLPSIGSWYGGIEAIVPFVKAAAGYETYIKLYNRYKPVNSTSPAKVYVANLNQINSSIVTSIKQLSGGSIKNSAGANDNSAIPVNGYITITATDLASVCTGATCTLATPATGSIIDGLTPVAAGGTELSQGAPIKFLIRVPAQMGPNGGFTSLTVNAGAGGTTPPSVVSTVGFDNLTGNGAAVATASVVDPYITGFVVSVYNNTAQRSVPIVFKSFKQGQYN